MVDFTREIKTLEKQAASSPQFRPASSNAVADTANLVSTGFQLFQQNRAQTQLQELRAQEAAQQEDLAKGVLGLRELRQALVNQGVSRTTLQQKEAEFLNQYSPTMQVDIIGGAKRVTGETLSTFSDELTQQQKDRRALEEQAATLSPYMTDIPESGASDEQLAMHIIQASSVKASMDKRMADERLTAARLGNEESIRRVDARTFGSQYMTQRGFADSQRLTSLVRQVDLKSPEATKALLTDIQNVRASVIPDMLQQAASSSIIMTQEEAAAQAGPILAIYDTLQNQLLQEDARRMGDNQFQIFSQGLFNDLLTSDNPQEQTAARMIGLMEFANLQDVGGSLISGYLSTIARGYTTSLADGVDKKIVDEAITKSYNLSEAAPSDVQQTYTDALLSDVNGPNKVREEFMTTGFVTHIEAISKGNPDYSIFSEDKDEVAQSFLIMSGDFVESSIAQMLNNPALVSVKGRESAIRQKKGSQIETAQGVEAFTINPDLTVSIPAGDLYLSNTAKQYNRFIRNMGTALPKLGVQDKEMEEFYSRIIRTYQTTPVEEE